MSVSYSQRSLARAKKPVKLGEVSAIGMGQSEYSLPRPVKLDISSYEEDSKRSLRKPLLAVALAVVVVLAVGAFLFLGGSDILGGDTSDSSSVGQTTAPAGGISPTAFPTVLVTPAPIASTTPSTFAPSTEVSSPTPDPMVPTRSPTAFPTNSPVTDCVNPDAQCGCNQVTSALVDIIIMLDESASVTITNFLTMKNAVVEFVSELEAGVDVDDGARIAYIEFDNRVTSGGTYGLNDPQDLDSVVSFIQGTSYGNGYTQQIQALQTANTILSSRSPREGSQTILVMVTDGNPCSGDCPGRPQNGCCRGDELRVGGADLLSEMFQEYNFTFYFLPIDVQGFNTELYDNSGLGDSLVKLPVNSFDDLSSVLGESVTIPLGPCVNAPTSSTAKRRVLYEEGSILDDLDFLT